jgi:hypothetical protein
MRVPLRVPAVRRIRARKLPGLFCLKGCVLYSGESSIRREAESQSNLLRRVWIIFTARDRRKSKSNCLRESNYDSITAPRKQFSTLQESDVLMTMKQSAFGAEAWAIAWLHTRKNQPRKGFFEIPRTSNPAIGGNPSTKIK